MLPNYQDSQYKRSLECLILFVEKRQCLVSTVRTLAAKL